jgi:nucleoside-diphosphate-sugar epimerase
MDALITGGEGFLGSHLHDELVSNGHSVSVIDLRNGHDLLEPGFADFAIGIYKPDVVVHFAAQVGRVFGEDDVRHTIESNALMTTYVAQACAKHDVRLMYASTSEVYGDQGNHICHEHDICLLPHNLYGLSKRWGEEAAELYAPRGLQIIRPSMPYGTGLPPGRGRAAIVNFLHCALYRKPILVHRNSERSWCWVGDTVRAIRLVLEAGETATYNVGRSDNPTSMEDVAKIACKLTGASESLITLMDAPANQTTVKRLSNNAIRSLGWKPTVELEAGMKLILPYVESFDKDCNRLDETI